MRIRNPELLAALSSCLVACAPTTIYRSAHPVDRGAWRGSAAIGLGALRDTEQDTRIPILPIEVAARRGVTGDLDLGGRLYTFGAEINATFRVHRRGPWAIGLVPALGGLKSRRNNVIPEAIHLHAALTVPVTYTLNPRVDLSFGPLSGWGLYWPEGGGHAQGLWLGAFTNLDIRIGTRWHLLPELSVFRVATGEVPVRGGGLTLGAAFARDW